MVSVVSGRRRLWILYLQLLLPINLRSISIPAIAVVAIQALLTSGLVRIGGSFSAVSDLIAFVVLIVVLLVRPYGLSDTNWAQRHEALVSVKQMLFHSDEVSESYLRYEKNDEAAMTAEEVQTQLLAALRELEPSIVEGEELGKEVRE